MTILVAAVGPIASSIESGPLFDDDFDRANANPIGGNWTTTPGCSNLKIVSNKLVNALNLGSAGSAYVNSVTPDDDQYAQCAISGTLSGGGPCVRVQTVALLTMYGLQIFGTTQADLFYYAAAAYNALDSASITHTPGDVYKVTVQGTTIKGYQNGVEILSATDANLASGRLGQFAYDGTSQFDDFEGGNL